MDALEDIYQNNRLLSWTAQNNHPFGARHRSPDAPADASLASVESILCLYPNAPLLAPTEYFARV
ncbi:predicted protein [Plenodomus lingam JN3]|uniref:Predicted protein n=1 Tax=Leptosphaeria maculans (strain JN3 / isolate v23.1.3 / race Av1-4-5-6-7-8) TaxID=985895 RepID=E4ZQL0_LEPMJ|nr:predicted protein [Plenodomus lingam JN3]CBX94015.1 predicted protein [Plenodomus lingam JN3]